MLGFASFFGMGFEVMFQLSAFYFTGSWGIPSGLTKPSKDPLDLPSQLIIQVEASNKIRGLDIDPKEKSYLISSLLLWGPYHKGTQDSSETCG